MSTEIEIVASDKIKAALKCIGRTEDVKLSPDNRRLALATYFENKIGLIDIEIEASRRPKTVSLSHMVEITTPDLAQPHGVSFLDQDTLAVANRSGAVSILKLPPRGTGEGRLAGRTLRTVRGGLLHRLRTPGSVWSGPLGQGLHEMFVCNNHANRVTRHVLDAREDFRVRRNEVLLSKWLTTPDGIAVDRERRWIAVSNHGSHGVFMFEMTQNLKRRSRPHGILRYSDYPHGLCFTPDGRYIIVALSGSKNVHVYAKTAEGWHGEHEPINAVRTMSTETFLRGRIDHRDGGTKGVDVDNDMRLLAVTSEFQTLAFFDLASVLRPSRPEERKKPDTPPQELWSSPAQTQADVMASR